MDRSAVQAQHDIGKEIDVIEKIVQLNPLAPMVVLIRAAEVKIRMRLAGEVSKIALAQTVARFGKGGFL